MPGVPPKPQSQRRRRNVPASYGAAEPVTAPAASPQRRELGLEHPHPLVASMWENIQSSCEATFYSEADWARLRLEMWYANQAMRGPITGAAWATIQRGLNDMLISPADKRRAAIELKPTVPDTDEIAAVSLMSTYKSNLKPM